ncbi:MAG: UDP-4-amino-4,6-dideoxy-N-acetyl-beta-L-altrosamine N-acetyltransferase [Pseudomonadota bacterium]
MSEKSNLRPVTFADAALTLGWRNQTRVRNFMFNTALVHLADHEVWLERVIDDPHLCYFVFEENDVPIGLVGLIFRDRASGEAEWSFYRGVRSAKKGAGLRMLQLALDRFFCELGGKLLRAEVLEDNIASKNLHEKLGFQMVEHANRTVMHRSEQKQVFQYTLDVLTWQA